MTKMIDLFAGCGGLSLGISRGCGATPVLAVELDADAAATYRLNHPSAHVLRLDARSLPPLPTADLVVGGPPCQGFSALGRRDPHDPRSALVGTFGDVVASVLPKVFVMENVPELLTSARFVAFLADLPERYEVTYGVLDASRHGSAQRRLRAIVVGSRVGTPSLPEPLEVRRRTVRDAIGDLPAEPDGIDLPGPGPYRTGLLHLGRRPTPLSLARYAAVPEGGNRFDLPAHLLPPCWRDKPTGTADVMGRLRWDGPSVTVRTEFFKPEKGRYLHPEADRPITHLEAARLQGFPDDMLWTGSKTSIARQIGNAVPVELGAAVGRAIAPLLADHTRAW